MLGNRRAVTINTEMLFRSSGVPNVSKPPNWEFAQYVYKGTSSQTSYDHTRPEAYRRKDERGHGRPAR